MRAEQTRLYGVQKADALLVAREARLVHVHKNFGVAPVSGAQIPCASSVPGAQTFWSRACIRCTGVPSLPRSLLRLVGSSSRLFPLHKHFASAVVSGAHTLALHAGALTSWLSPVHRHFALQLLPMSKHFGLAPVSRCTSTLVSRLPDAQTLLVLHSSAVHGHFVPRLPPVHRHLSPRLPRCTSSYG